MVRGISCPRDRWAWVEIDLDALRQNTSALKRMLAPDVQMMCVVKADAYGHGAVRCAKAMRRSGADQFAVATVTEGVELRENGIREPILILSEPPYETIQSIVDHDLMPAVYNPDFALGLGEAAFCFDIPNRLLFPSFWKTHCRKVYLWKFHEKELNFF